MDVLTVSRIYASRSTFISFSLSQSKISVKSVRILRNSVIRKNKSDSFPVVT